MFEPGHKILYFIKKEDFINLRNGIVILAVLELPVPAF